MDFDRTSLKALSAILREGSFEAAADKLGMTQPSVSARIKSLENRVGAQLIVRARPCVATNYGQILAKLADQISYLEVEATRALEELGMETGRRPSIIKVAVNADSLATWFPRVVKRAQRELNIFLDILVDDQTSTYEHLTKGEVAGALSTETLKLPGSTSTPLGTMDYIPVASPEFVGAYFADGFTAEAFRNAPAIIYDRKDRLVRRWAEQAFGETQLLEGHVLPSFGGYLAGCLNGTGWGMMPTISVTRYLLDAELVDLSEGRKLAEPLFWHISARRSKVLNLLSKIVADEASILQLK